VLKSQVALNELELNSTDIMCSLVINKYINCPNQYESLSLTKYNFFYNIKRNKISKDCKPKIIRFVNYNKYKKILKINRENKFYCNHHFEIQKTPNLEIM
jgi:hypothetical protein